MSTFNIDHQREGRVGFPEIIYGRSKDIESIKLILQEYKSQGKNAMITKLQSEKSHQLQEIYSSSFYDPIAEIFMLEPITQQEPGKDIAILSAGTSDLFVVNEAMHTLSFLGHTPQSFQDIGVSGIHRLMSRLEQLRVFKVLIVIAGFEGALPTVAGGLLPQPIIAVPTSVGYGVAEGGTVALQTMLASCANGITVVNIDNGYGAAVAALRILNTFKK